MYNQYFGLDSSPFKITPDPRLFYGGARRGDVLQALVYAITSGEGIIKVVGEVGVGKTMLCRMLEVSLPANVETVYLANPSVSPEDILHAIALEMGLEVDDGDSRLKTLRAIQQHLLDKHARNEHVVVLVEEAQGMPNETLEEIRLLSNLETGQSKMLQIVLFGQPELDEKLQDPSIRQLRERITHSLRLEPLTSEEVREYVDFRLRQVGYRGRDAFRRGAYKSIARASRGLTRRVNILADKALLAAYAEDTHDVSGRHVEIAAKDSEYASRLRMRWPELVIGSGAVLIALMAAAWWLQSGQASHDQTIESRLMPEVSQEREAEPAQAPEPGKAPAPGATPAASVSPPSAPKSAAPVTGSDAAAPARPDGPVVAASVVPTAGASAVPAGQSEQESASAGPASIESDAALIESATAQPSIPAGDQRAEPAQGQSASLAEGQPNLQIRAGGLALSDTLAVKPFAPPVEVQTSVPPAETAATAGVTSPVPDSSPTALGSASEGQRIATAGQPGAQTSTAGSVANEVVSVSAVANAPASSKPESVPISSVPISSGPISSGTAALVSAGPLKADAVPAGTVSVESVATRAEAGASPPSTGSVAPAASLQSDDASKASSGEVAPVAASAGAAAIDRSGSPATPRVQAKTSNLVDQRLQATRDWLQAVDIDSYSIQLMLTHISRRNALEQFLRGRQQVGDLGDVFVYETQIKSRTWFGVLYRSYSSFSAARRALQALPKDLSLHAPFIRNVSDINTLG